jgi:tRNA threonylcarbamoyl adenosine modification protein YeaZ
MVGAGAVGLGITTSGPVAAALIVSGAEYVSSSTKPALEGTLPAIRDLLARAKLQLSAVDYLAVCAGPGSFTGLRIGVAFAKSVAQATGIRLYGVSAYDVAEFGAEPIFPNAAVVEGKRDYFYVRLSLGAAENVVLLRGTSAELREPLAGIRASPLSEVPAGERALRVARIGHRSYDAGMPGDWRSVAIDYGQRPNAEMNWDSRNR